MKNNKIDKSNWKTTRKERIGYSIGFNGCVGESLTLQAYLSTYLLMSGIDVGITATVMLVMKLIDALDDILFGWIVDKYHPEKNPKLAKLVGTGRYLPWLRLCLPVFPIAVTLLYRIPTDASQNVKVFWFAFFYLLSDLAYTLIDVPMNSILTTMTDVSSEKDSIIRLRNIFMLIIVGFVYFGFLVLISQKVGMSISNCVLLFSVCMTICMLPVILFTKEHSIMVSDHEEESSLSLKEAFQCLISNRNLLAHYGGSCIAGCFATGTACSIFASYYLFGSEFYSLLLSVPSLILGTALGIVIPGLVVNRDKNRLRVLSVVLSIITGVIAFLVGYKNVLLYMAASLLNVIPASLATAVSSYIVPNCIEYGKFKSGKDATGIQFAFGTFTAKFPSAIASSLGLYLLKLYGWQTITAESFAEVAALGIVQSETAIRGLWVVTAGIPIIGTVLSLLCYLAYNLTDKDAEIMARCNAGEINRQEAEKLLSKVY